MKLNTKCREEIMAAILREGLNPRGVDTRKLYRSVVSSISRYQGQIIEPLEQAGLIELTGERLRTTERGREFYEKFEAMIDMIRTPEMRREIQAARDEATLFNKLFL